MKRAIIHSVLLITMLLATGVHPTIMPEPTVGTWQFKAPMPVGRSGATAVALGDYIYVIGGRTEAGAVSGRVDRYDPASDNWDVVSSLGEARFNAASVVWGNSIVVIGGRGESNETLNSVEQFDPEMNAWVALGGLMNSREGHAAVVLNGVIYTVGGSDAQGQIYDSVELYNPDQNSWGVSDQWQLDFPRASFAMATANDSAFAIGGFNTFGPLGFVQRFHPAEGVASRERITPARGGLAAVYKGDRIFALGGVTAGNQAVSATDVYFPMENRWATESPMNIPRAQFPAVVFENEVYVFGGEDALGTITGTVEVFTTGVPPTASDDAFSTNEDESITFDVLANDEDQVGTALTISGLSQPAGGTVVLGPTVGMLTYTPARDFNGTDRFTYTIVNGEGSIAIAEVVITVLPVNDPPQFASSPVTTGVTGITYEYEILVQDADGPAIAITADAIPGWLMLVDNGNGQARLSGAPAVEDVGNHLVTLRGSDGAAEQVQSFIVTVIEGIPPVPTLISPANNADSTGIPVLFTWSNLGATSWDLQVARNNQFTDIAVNIPNLSAPTVEVSQLDVGLTYFWRVRATNGLGTSDWSSPFSFTTANAVNTTVEDEIPQTIVLLQPPYPNPATETVWIELQSSFATHEPLSLGVYDLRGRLVVSLYDGVSPGGRIRFSWDGTNDWGQSVASGTYYVRMLYRNQQQTRSLVLLR